MTPEKTEQPRISVIVPVYNVWRYVGQCMHTLVNQTVGQPYEVVVVNDGSTDHSRGILRWFEERYPFVRVIDQENAGVSAARTAGLRAARGEYVCFVDSDDYVSENYLERLLLACTENGADISCCSYYCHLVGNDILFEYFFHCQGVYDTAGALNMLLRDTYIQSYLWGKMFKKELFSRARVQFPKMCFEDLAMLNQVFAQARCVAVLDASLYFYNVRSDSTLGKMSPQKINDYLRAIVMVRKALEQGGQYARYRKSYRYLVNKTWFCCNLYLVKMHFCARSSFFAWLRDIIDLATTIVQYRSDSFSATQALADLPEALGDRPRRRFRLPQRDLPAR